jgi:hypothetical protein
MELYYYIRRAARGVPLSDPPPPIISFSLSIFPPSSRLVLQFTGTLPVTTMANSKRLELVGMGLKRTKQQAQEGISRVALHLLPIFSIIIIIIIIIIILYYYCAESTANANYRNSTVCIEI